MASKGGYFMTDEEKAEWEKKQKEQEKLIDKCVFCNIAFRNDARADVLYKDSSYVVFRDISPAAKEHYLVIPKQHIKNTKSLGYDDIPMIENMIDVAKICLAKHEADVNDVRYGFHLSPMVSVDHLHLHAISPASKIGFFGRLLFRPDSYWFLTVETLLKNLSEKPSKFWNEKEHNGDWYKRQRKDETQKADTQTENRGQNQLATSPSANTQKQGSAV
ncbi:adenosine 5'-monophosphoramidase HINT3-like [Ptychodera flava]|uniref:adenosine 5'-monophosphoramidase HINT3-like n=1 Tax=Ptychodera flava TaxID=63121 RepID=UPI00396A02B8